MKTDSGVIRDSYIFAMICGEWMSLKNSVRLKGFPFTVDSKKSHEGSAFDMGEAAGHFSYIEDPDGTLIEFVETQKVPVLKKFGLYLDLRKRDPNKSLPDWMVKTLRFSRGEDLTLLDFPENTHKIATPYLFYITFGITPAKQFNCNIFHFCNSSATVNSSPSVKVRSYSNISQFQLPVQHGRYDPQCP